MASNPLLRLSPALPVLAAANQLRRRVEAKLRGFDVIRWTGVPYGPDPAQQLYFWQLNDLGPRDGWPAVLLIHGGGWTEGSAEAFEALGPTLAHRGLMAVALDYRLAPEHPWPAQREDLALALSALRHQQVDSSRIALWGHSAGGHLALTAALDAPDQVRCCVALGAPTDLVRLDEEGKENLDPVFSRAALREASPLYRSGPLPPTLLVHGTLDATVSVAHARALAAARPSEVQLLELPDGDHGLRWPPVAALKARREALDWMVAQLAPEPRGGKWKYRKKKKR